MRTITFAIAVTIVSLAYGQAPDSVKQKTDSLQAGPADKPVEQVREKETAAEQSPDSAVTTDDNSRTGSQPRIIYYQTRPEPTYESRYRTRTRSNRNDIKTLAGSMNHSGGFGALSFRSTEFRDEAMVLAGLRGGWIINRTLGIGVEGHGIIPTAKFNDIDTAGSVIALGGYGGMFLELIFLSNWVVHVTFPVSAGAGWLGYNTDFENNDPNPGTDSLIDEDIFWYVEPGANIEVNISRNFRMDFGISKRLTQDLELMNTETKAFENINYYVTLKVGSF